MEEEKREIHYNVKDVLGKGVVLCNGHAAHFYITSTYSPGVTCEECLALLKRRQKFLKVHQKELVELRFHIF